MNFSDLQKIDGQSTVDLFNLTIAELSAILDRQFRRDSDGSYMCVKNKKACYLPRPLSLQDVRSSFYEEDGKKILLPIAFYSLPFKEAGIQRHEVKIEYNPQFLYGKYASELPEVCVSLYGSEVSKSEKVLERMKELKLRPNEKLQALADRSFICASLNI